MAKHDEKLRLEREGELHAVQFQAERELFGQVRVRAWGEQLDERQNSQARTSVPPPGLPAQLDERARATPASANGGAVKVGLRIDLGTSRRNVRASDEDRDRAASSLREHFAAGRLEEVELERRVDRAYAAHSRRELAELFSDLPTDRLGPGIRLYRGLRTALKYHALTYVTINGSLVGMWELSGHPRGVWPMLVIMPTSVLLVLHATASHWLRRELRIGRGRTDA